MSRDDIIKMAREAGFEILLVDGQEEVGCGDGYYFQTDEIESFFKLAFEAGRKAEQERCCSIVIGLAGSDNVAHRTVKAIRSDK